MLQHTKALDLSPLLFHINTFSLEDLIQLHGFTIGSMLMPAVFLSLPLTSPLISRLIYPNGYWTFLLGCPMDNLRLNMFETEHLLHPHTPQKTYLLSISVHVIQSTQLLKTKTRHYFSICPYPHPYSKNKFCQLQSTSWIRPLLSS